MTLALRLGAGTQDRLARHVNPQLGRVEHLDAENVVLAAVACPQRFGHRRDPDTEQPTPLLRFFLLLQEVVVAHRLQADVETFGVLAGVGQEPESGAMRKIVILDEVHATELGLIHTEVVRCGLHHPFLKEHRLRDTERAPIRHTARRLVRVVAPRCEVSRRNVVASKCRMHEPDLELARLRIREEGAMIGVGVHSYAEDSSVLSHCHLAAQVDVTPETGRDQVAALVLDPFHRTFEKNRREDRGDVARIDGNLVAETTPEIR